MRLIAQILDITIRKKSNLACEAYGSCIELSYESSTKTFNSKATGQVFQPVGSIFLDIEEKEKQSSL